MKQAIASILRASVSPEPNTCSRVAGASRPTEPWQLRGLAGACAFHGIAAYVDDAIRDVEHLPTSERQRIRALRNGAALRHLRSIVDLDFLRSTFESCDIPWLVLKGPVLAEPVHGAGDRRSYGDLDVLVPPNSLRDTLAALEEAGATVLDRNWDLLRRELKGEVHLSLPSGSTLDLHWHLLNDRGLRGVFAIPLHSLFEGSEDVTVGTLRVPTLGPTETLVYVALHMVLSGAHRLVWLKDLERLLRQPSFRPSEVLDVARRWQAGLTLSLALTRMQRALGQVQEADSLLARLPSAPVWRSVAWAAWRLAPAEREDGRGSVARIVARATRDSQTTSLGELRRRVTRHLRDDDGRERYGRRLPKDYAGSAWYPAGGPEGRKAFLTAVEREPR